MISPEGSTSPAGCTWLHFHAFQLGSSFDLVFFGFFAAEKWKDLERTGHVLIIKFPWFVLSSCIAGTIKNCH